MNLFNPFSKPHHPRAIHQGFTLAEVVITIGVIATLLTTFIAVFGLTTNRIRETIDSQEADRLATALERELSILRESEANDNTRTAFAKAYEWIELSSRGDSSRILLYNYEGNPSELRDDGTMAPIPKDAEGKADSVVTPAVRFVGAGDLPEEMRAELEVASGPVFFVKLTQLVYDESGKLVRGEPGIVPPHPNQKPLAGAATPPDAYPEAAIAIMADFHLLPTSDSDYIAQLDITRFRRPDFSRPIGVRR